MISPYGRHAASVFARTVIQVKSGKYTGAIPANGNKEHPRSTELRIDHNQHAMSALIEFLETYVWDSIVVVVFVCYVIQLLLFEDQTNMKLIK